MYDSRETTPGVGLRFSKGSDVNTVSVVDDSYNRGGNTTIEAGNGQFNIVKRRSGNNYIHVDQIDRFGDGSDVTQGREESHTMYDRTTRADSNVVMDASS